MAKTRPLAYFSVPVLLVVGFTLLALVFHQFGVSDAAIVLTLLMAPLTSAVMVGTLAGVGASLLAILSHSYFFSHPLFSLEVSDPKHYLSFTFMVIVSVVVGLLAGRLKEQTRLAQGRSRRLELINRFSRELSAKITRDDLFETANSLLLETTGGQARLSPAHSPPAPSPALLERRELRAENRLHGYLDLHQAAGPTEDALGPLADTLASTLLLAFERLHLIEESRAAALAAETEKVRGVLLQGISHDLRTPLTVISATAGRLSQQGLSADQQAGLDSIRRETDSLIHQVINILELTKLTSGPIKPNKEWHPAEDVVFSCLGHLRSRFPEADIDCQLPETPELGLFDAPLLERALVNLLENALTHGSGPITLSLTAGPEQITWTVADRGPGVPEHKTGDLFRPSSPGPHSGRRKLAHGFGLAIVKAVTDLHGGQCGHRPRSGGGSEFWITIPQGAPA